MPETKKVVVAPATTSNTATPREGVANKGADWRPGQTFDLAPVSATPVPPGALLGTTPSVAPAAPAAPAAPEAARDV